MFTAAYLVSPTNQPWFSEDSCLYLGNKYETMSGLHHYLLNNVLFLRKTT